MLGHLTTRGAADSGKAIGLGLMIASDDQLAAGATAFPGPLADADADWLWHSYMLLATVTTTAGDNTTAGVARIEVDSKAMRRVKQNDNLVFVAEPDNVGGGSETAGKGSGLIEVPLG